MRPRRNTSCVMLSMLFAGAVHPQAFPPGFVHPRPLPEPKPYEGPLRLGEAAPGWYAVRAGEWEVAPDVVDRMRVLLGERAGRPLDDYRIQYRAVVQYGHRTVRVAGYCRTMFLSERDLVEDRIVVADGGACFFNASYDPEGQRFTHFSFHGNG